MGNCCSGTTTIPSSPSPPSPVAGGEAALSQVDSQPKAEDALAPSCQPRSRTTSMPPVVHSAFSSQGSNRRSRAVSAPQRPRSKSSVRQNAITRPQPVVLHSRNSLNWRASDPEQSNVAAGAATFSHPIRNSPPSTVKQIKKLQISRGKTIRASIEAGRNGHWRNLWSRVEFAYKPLMSYVDVIHAGIVETWNLDDTNRVYLSSDRFKINMSHIVKDLAVPARGALRGPGRNKSGDEVADWVYAAYEGRQEIIQCLMGYIVDLHVILDDITKAAIRDVTDNDALDIMNEHARSGRRNSIHQDIRNFVTETYPTRFTNQKDQALEKIIDLIKQYCDLPSGYI